MRGKIALFLHQPKCSVQSGNGIMRALSPHYDFKIFTKHDLEEDFFDDVDIICFPGGIGNSDSFDYLLKSNKDRIEKFLLRGGKYLGICMGAYWAGPHYFDILKNIRAEQYIRRPGTDTRRPHAKGQTVFWQGQKESMFFYDGCSLIGSGVNHSDVWAVYPNGDAMALIQNNIGIIGCHPESDRHWYESYSWMPRHWHKGRHHALLLEFVNELMKK
jgi:hypothetical protein